MTQWPAILTLAEAAPTAGAGAGGTAAAPWWQVLLNNSFSLALLFIFLVAIISAVVNMRRRDKCLKLLRGHHVTYLTTPGRIIWGDLRVYNQGVELCFDAPHQTREGVIKTSELVYEPKLTECLAICRTSIALTERERRARQRQVRRSFNPGLLRRLRRVFVNFMNTIRDAFSKAISTVIGHFAAVRPGSAVLTQQRAGVDQIGQTLLGTVARAYEPLLERHIGRPVVLTMTNPGDEQKRRIELPGFLVDYSDKYVAVFNVSHEPFETLKLTADEDVEKPNIRITLQPTHMLITCTGPDVLVIERVTSGDDTRDLHIALLPSTSLRLPRQEKEPLTIELQRTRQVDIVCPRSIGTVLFGGEMEVRKRQWFGLAPQQPDETD
jgi:hypothetical protein